MPKENNTMGEHEIFATRLRGLMEKKNTTHQQLAYKLNVSRQAVSSYYFGKRQPNFQKLIEIAEYFNVSTDYLLGVTELRNYDEIKEIKQSTEVFAQIEDPLVLEDIKDAFKCLGAIGKSIETHDLSSHVKTITNSIHNIFLSYRKSMEGTSVDDPLSKMKYLEFRAFTTDKIDALNESVKIMANELANNIKEGLKQGDG
ncbi:MAG: helix-turn-helix transcriptional regulator [Clostridiales bacterium]|nr:helix-turn-helix transcriptional regulator [Clostridiales bacterium]